MPYLPPSATGGGSGPTIYCPYPNEGDTDLWKCAFEGGADIVTSGLSGVAQLLALKGGEVSRFNTYLEDALVWVGGGEECSRPCEITVSCMNERGRREKQQMEHEKERSEKVGQ